MTVQVARNDLSFWVDTPDRFPCAPLQGEARAEIAIVGGGFSGLSAAYHLIQERPDLDIVLLESEIVGCGASGRNTGILRPGVGGTILDLCRHHGQEGARRLYQASLGAVEHVRDMIRGERLACDLEDPPHLKLALTTKQAGLLQREAEMLARLGFTAEYSDAAQVADLAPIRSCGGLCYPQGGQLNPALLSRELKRIVIERGVRVYEKTPVASITPGKTTHLELSRGTLVANRVILATNAHTPQLGMLSGQIIPIQTHVSVSEPLTATQLSGLAWEGRRSLSDKRHIFNYYRLTRDNRIMFGGGRPIYRAAKGNASAGATDIAEPKIWREQRHLFAQVVPVTGGGEDYQAVVWYDRIDIRSISDARRAGGSSGRVLRRRLERTRRGIGHRQRCPPRGPLVRTLDLASDAPVEPQPCAPAPGGSAPCPRSVRLLDGAAIGGSTRGPLRQAEPPRRAAPALSNAPACP